MDIDATSAEYSLKHEFGVTIEGDLNEEEVKDLPRLFRNIANIFKQYLSGQDVGALADTANWPSVLVHCHLSQVWTSVWMWDDQSRFLLHRLSRR